MSYLEVIALISTIVCVVLSAREHIWAWPIGIISALSLILVYIGGGMYANIALQSVFVIQCAIGWYNWGKKDNVVITKLPFNKVFLHTIGALLIGWVYAKIKLDINPNEKWFNAYFDGISTTIALLGNWYLTKKILQAWPLFMTYNVIISILLISQGIYSLAALNIVLCCISFNGFTKWKRDLKKV